MAGSSLAFANAELDRSYALETVGILRSWDNVDGLFVDYVNGAYKEFFSHESRFVLQDISKADTALSRTTLPYQKLIQDPQVLGQVARATRSESLIRTIILKEGSQYRFTLEWLHSPQMIKMAEDTFMLTDLADVQGALQKALARLISKIPFIGNVTGRDSESVTVNIGDNANLFQGDTLVIGTLDEVKKHPLLKTVMAWRLTQVGKVVVDTVEDRMAFGHVIEEEETRKVARFQKVMQVIPKPVVITKQEQEGVTPLEQVPPKLGYVVGGLGIGTASRDFRAAAAGFTGSGIYFGPKAEAQLWINREWFTELGLAYGIWNYSQKSTGEDVSAASGAASATLSSFRFNLGYSYFLTNDFFGPKGSVRLGYEATSFSFPLDSTALLAPVSFKGLFLGLGGELPLRGKWAALLNLNFSLFPSASQTSTSNIAAASASFMNFSVGASYRSSQRLSFRANLDVAAHGADFPEGAVLSQKVIAITPAVLYYF